MEEDEGRKVHHDRSDFPLTGESAGLWLLKRHED